jgi:hypothetical protein
VAWQAGPNLACRLTRREEKSAAACFLLCCTHAVGTDGPRGAWSTRRSSRVCVYMKRVVGGGVKRVPFEERERGWRGEGDAGKQRKVEHQRKSHEVER